MNENHEQFPAHDNVRGAADAVARRSYGKLVALLASRSGDLAAAEDALSDAFVSALQSWPTNGVPTNPEAWLMTVARRKVIDLTRRQRMHESAVEQMQPNTEWFDPDSEDPNFPDHRLGLMFACAHPAIDSHIRAPLILQTILGLNATMIGSAFLTSPATMGQRLVRAKSKIKQANIPLRIPEREELPGRIDAVLDAIYAAFAEGWIDPRGADVARRELAEDAIYLGWLVTQLLPEEPEALGLLALMMYAEARRGARRNSQGEFVPLAQQDISLWDSRMIEAAETLLLRASKFENPGRYQIEAAIQSAHVHRRKSGHANWPAIVKLYDELLAISESPVVAINRGIAIAETQGPQAALREMDAIAKDSRLNEYQPYWAARAELLAQSGAKTEARQAYDVAIGLERDPALREFLQRRQGELNSKIH